MSGSRANAGMAAIDIPQDDVTAVAVYIHSVLATARGQGAPPPGPAMQLNILVGDAAAGAAYFNAKCTSCQSATGDLAGIGRRESDPMRLQNLWVGGGRNTRRDPTGPPRRRDVIAANFAYVREAAAWGVKMFFTCIMPGDPARKRDENYRLAVESFAPIAEACAATGTSLAIAHGILASQPDNVPALAEAGDAQAAMGDRLSAETSYKQALRLAPHL